MSPVYYTGLIFLYFLSIFKLIESIIDYNRRNINLYVYKIIILLYGGVILQVVFQKCSLVH
jgi:hypothetical protein